jgi:hypothetical protein
MRSLSRNLIVALMAVAFAVPVAVTGCAGHARYYDADHGDYHVWDNNEAVYYNRWETETHRDHKDFNKRSADEQKEYWNWRHNQH